MTTDLCPWLGTAADTEVRHAEAMAAHVCYAQRRPEKIALDYQTRFCLVTDHRTCTFYREPPAPLAPVPPKTEADEVGLPQRRFRWWLLALWLVALALVAVAIYLYVPSLRKGGSSAGTATPSATFAAAPTAAGVPAPPTDSGFTQTRATPTPYPGGAIYSMAPEANTVGWVKSDEGTSNHFGDSYLYSGVFNSVLYQAALQFDLSAVPAGATIHSGVLELTGLDRLRVTEGGTWEVRILTAEADQEWSGKTYQAIHDAAVRWTLAPALSSADLLPGQVNTLELPPQVLRDLELRLLDGHTTLSLRLDGPSAGSNNVFAWDTGYGSATRGNQPRLVLSVGPSGQAAPVNGTPSYVVVTSTPIPGNVLTAAAVLRTATAVALTTAQPPGMVVYVTATPTVVVTSVPTAANQATVEYERALATAIAMTTGTYTPTPLSFVTATPTLGNLPPASPTASGTASSLPSASPTASGTPSPRPTASPTVSGTPSPRPTASATASGTPPPPPTATATPQGATPRPATATPQPPDELQDKILFRSDRQVSPNPWAMNADGTGAFMLADGSPYEAALALESLSPDGRQRVYVGTVDGMPAILIAPTGGGQGQPLVAFQDAQLFTPVWSPVGNRIAFVSGTSNSGQIWLISANGAGLRELTMESWGAASHPTFSPDGLTLAYASAAGSGSRQIWLIGIDGNGRINLSDNAYDDWDPVWVK